MARTSIATDSFTYSDGTLSTVSGGNWASLNIANAGAASVASNKVLSTYTIALASGGDTTERWAGTGTFSDNQYSKASVTLAYWTADYYVGVIVRASSDTGANRDYYGLVVQCDSGGSKTTRLYKVVNGTYTSLASTTVAWSDTGDTISLEVDGTSLYCYRNDAIITALTTTDSSLSTGKPGIAVSTAASALRIDDWDGGDVTSGGSTKPAFYYAQL